MSPPKKIDRLCALLRAEDWGAALALAARFPVPGRGGDRGDLRTVQLAHEARTNPAFYRQLGKDPAVLFRAGVTVLLRLYGAQAGLHRGDAS